MFVAFLGLEEKGQNLEYFASCWKKIGPQIRFWAIPWVIHENKIKDKINYIFCTSYEARKAYIPFRHVSIPSGIIPLIIFLCF